MSNTLYDAVVNMMMHNFLEYTRNQGTVLLDKKKNLICKILSWNQLWWDWSKPAISFQDLHGLSINNLLLSLQWCYSISDIKVFPFWHQRFPCVSKKYERNFFSLERIWLVFPTTPSQVIYTDLLKIYIRKWYT